MAMLTDHEYEIKHLRQIVDDREFSLRNAREKLMRATKRALKGKETRVIRNASNEPRKWPLEEDDYERYKRQLILPEFGDRGQLQLKHAKVLIVGAGGLGCPAATYLAGAGIGKLGIIDGDAVETSNLHRQTAHATSRVGSNKANSLVHYLSDLNPSLDYVTYEHSLDASNAATIIKDYDIVLDCTDNPATRYLISDMCVLLKRPLVSASALRTDGQLIVLNTPPAAIGNPNGGPCYRCVFPNPPPPETVVSCGEGGVFGPAVGTMGVLQAGEAIKILLRTATTRNTNPRDPPPPASLLIFSSPLSGPPSLRTARMRGRRPDCFACGATSTLTLASLRDGSAVDYVRFCGSGAPDPAEALSPDERVSARDYSTVLRRVTPDHLLLDVREPEHFAIAQIDGAVNVPFSVILHDGAQRRIKVEDGEEREAVRPEWLPPTLTDTAPIYVVCRLGNDSQVVARRLKQLGLDYGGKRFIGDIHGGMRAWKEEVDPTMPFI